MRRPWSRLTNLCFCLAFVTSSAMAAEWSFSRKYEMPRNIKAVDFYDAMNGAFVCDRATVAVTRDGGLSWTAGSLNSVLPPQSRNSTFLDVFYLDGANGWLVGENGVLFNTTDGGDTWVPQNSGTYAVLNDIFFLDESLGWVGGDGGLVFHTADGGKTWVEQDTRTNNKIDGVHFIDASIGVVVGGGGTILRTVDGGARWRSRRSPTALSFKSLHFIGNEGWAVGANGAAVYSSDGGDTWEGQDSSVPNSNGMPEPIWNIRMANPTLGLTGAEFGVILRTEDAGTTWTPLDPRPTLNRINDVAWASESTAIAVGEFGTVLRSTDAGVTWDTIYNNADLFSIEFANPTTGWAAGANGTLFATTDGASWERRDLQVPFQLFDLSFAGKEHGYVIGDNRTFLETHDGGNAWSGVISTGEGGEHGERVTTPDAAELSLAAYAVDFSDSQNGWFVGDMGRALRTVDGGKHWVSHWHSVQEVSLNTFYGLDVLDSTTMVAVGAAGTAVKTTDGGETWSSANTGVFNELRDVEFADGGVVGWIVGSGGVILVTADGGATWVEQTSNTIEQLNAIAAASELEAWAAGDSATLLHTTDAGITWRPVRHPDFPTRTTDLFGIDVTDDGRVWACGQWGAIFVYQ